MGSRMGTRPLGISENEPAVAPRVLVRVGLEADVAEQTSTRTAASKRPAAARSSASARAPRTPRTPATSPSCCQSPSARRARRSRRVARARRGRARGGARREVSDVRCRRRAVEAVGINVRVAVDRRAAGPVVCLVLRHAAVKVRAAWAPALRRARRRPRVLRVGRRAGVARARGAAARAPGAWPARARLRVVNHVLHRRLPATSRIGSHARHAQHAAASGCGFPSPLRHRAPELACGRPAQSSAAGGRGGAAGVGAAVGRGGGPEFLTEHEAERCSSSPHARRSLAALPRM